MTLVTFLCTCSWTELILLLMRTWTDCCSHLRRTWHCWTLPRALQGCPSPLRNHFLRFHREKNIQTVMYLGHRTPQNEASSSCLLFFSSGSSQAFNLLEDDCLVMGLHSCRSARPDFTGLHAHTCLSSLQPPTLQDPNQEIDTRALILDLALCLQCVHQSSELNQKGICNQFSDNPNLEVNANVTGDGKNFILTGANVSHSKR